MVRFKMLFAAVYSVLLAGLASALPNGPQPNEPQPIYGGQKAKTCQWPQAAGLYNGGSSQLCSAALIHPQIVAYAAHCGAGFTTLRLGEDVTSSARDVELESCHTHPDADGSPERDFAYCRLAEPVLDLPTIPPLVGCETSFLAEGAPMTLVGFGEIEGGTGGVKHWVDVAIDTYPFKEGLILAGGDGLGTCKWDSGAPGYVRLEDGSWRTAGVTFGTTLTCGAGTVLIPLFSFVDWIEEHSGIDVTPCHEGDVWSPDGRCDRLALDPDIGVANWFSGCEVAVSGPVASCGDPYTATADDDPPTVAITDPADGTNDPGPTASFVVNIAAADDGWGLDSVTLAIGDMVTPELTLPPYTYTVYLPEGTWSLVANARDFAGNEASSRPVVINVGTPSATTMGETDGDTTGHTTQGASTGDATDTSGIGGSDASSMGGSEATSAGAESTDSGCGCATGGTVPSALPFFALLFGARRRSRLPPSSLRSVSLVQPQRPLINDV